MGWISDTYEAIKSATAHAPIECPRGWGQVAFIASAWVVPPLFGVDRKCPISGAGACESCTYASNPDAFRLTEQLAELDRLRSGRQLSAEEHAARRTAVVRLHSAADRARRAQITTAWMTGPLGLALALAGIGLALWFHPAFWGLAGLGVVMVVVALSFWGLSRTNREEP